MNFGEMMMMVVVQCSGGDDDETCNCFKVNDNIK